MSLQACAEMVRKGDPDRFLAAMLAEGEGRGHLFALHAFNLEIARAPWVTAEPLIAEMRLQWWRDALDEIYSGATPRQHEVVLPLAEAIRAADLPRAALDAMIEARRHDIERRPMTPDEAFAYCDATAGNLMMLSVRALGVRGQAHHAARFLGQAQGVANFGRALPRMYAMGWRTLDGWDSARIEAGRPSDALQGAIAGLGDLGQVALLKARERATQLSRAARPATAAAWQTQSILSAMTHWKRRAVFMDTPLEPSEARRRFAILWRGAFGGV